MSLNDPLTLKFDPKRQKYWWQRGNETFYHEDTREWWQWQSIPEALDWAGEEHPKTLTQFDPSLFRGANPESWEEDEVQLEAGTKGAILGVLRELCNGSDQTRRELVAHLFEYPHKEMSTKLLSWDQWRMLDEWVGMEEDKDIKGYWWCRKGLPEEVHEILKEMTQ